MEATHICQSKGNIGYLPVKFEISSEELEYIIQFMLQNGYVVSHKSVLGQLKHSLLQCGEATFDGLFENNSEMELESSRLAKKLFPSFY